MVEIPDFVYHNLEVRYCFLSVIIDFFDNGEYVGVVDEGVSEPDNPGNNELIGFFNLSNLFLDILEFLQHGVFQRDVWFVIVFEKEDASGHEFNRVLQFIILVC